MSNLDYNLYLMKITDKEVFILNPENSSKYLLNSLFIEYLFSLILSTKYNFKIQDTDTSRKDFEINNKISFEFENSWDVLISNQECISNLRKIRNFEKDKDSIPTWGTPMRKLIATGSVTPLKEFESSMVKKYEKEIELFKSSIAKRVVDSSIYDWKNEVRTVFQNYYVFPEDKEIESILNKFIKSFWNSVSNKDIIIKSFINASSSKAIWFYFKNNPEFTEFLMDSFVYYRGLRNWNLTANGTPFYEFMERKMGKETTFKNIRKLIDMFERITYTQVQYDSVKKKMIEKKVEWIDFYYFVKKDFTSASYRKNFNLLYLTKESSSQKSSNFYSNLFFSLSSQFYKKFRLSEFISALKDKK